MKNSKPETINLIQDIVVWGGIIIFILYSCLGMAGGEDLWMAMSAGRHIGNHGVDTVDPFSVNSNASGPSADDVINWPGWARRLAEGIGIEATRYWHPTGWINQNWLSGIFFYKMAVAWGSAENLSFDVLVIFKFAIYIMVTLCVYAMGRTMGVRHSLSVISACFALWTGSTFFSIRPAEFTNLFVPVFILILLQAIYNRTYAIWLIVPLAVLWGNLHGGFIYLFIMLVPFALFNIPLQRIKKYSLTLNNKGILHTLGAGLAALLSVILFNPYKLTNLTHPFVIGLGKEAEYWRRIVEWRPAFDWKSHVGTAIPYLVLFIFFWVVLAVWLTGHGLANRTAHKGFAKNTQKKSEKTARKGKANNRFLWPKIPLSMLVISTLTMYMAVQSRRFIPIAAFITCPLMALLIQDVLKLRPSCVPILRRWALWIGTGITVYTAVLTGVKIHRAYIEPPPFMQEEQSLAIRMTNANREPFLVGEFLRMNSVKGTVLTGWREGSTLALSQNPDPETGKIPVQLFIDVRAQAAYKRKTGEHWQYIWNGGRVGQAIMKQQTRPDAEDYKELGEWVNQILEEQNVGFVLIALQDYGKNMFIAMETIPSWRIVYKGDRYSLYADLKTEEGRLLHFGIASGQTLYPSDYLRHLNQGFHALRYNRSLESGRKGLGLSIKAFQDFPTPEPMISITRIVTHHPQLIPEVNQYCESVLQDFQLNVDDYLKLPGRGSRLNAMALTSRYLGKVAEAQNNSHEAAMYKAKGDEYKSMADELSSRMMWRDYKKLE